MPTPPAPPPLPPPHLASSGGSSRQLGGGQPPSDPRTVAQQKQLTHVLNLWKSTPASSAGHDGGGGRSNHVNGSFGGGNGAAPAGPPAVSQKELLQLRFELETLQLKLSQVELKCLQSDQLIVELQNALALSGQERTQAQRQIERLSEGLESETLKAQEHRAQITYLTAQVKLLSEQRLDTTQATYWAVAGWVYVPLLLLVKGLWVILFPLISTIRRLTLFSSSSTSGGGGGSGIGAQSGRSPEEEKFLHEREYADHPVTHMMKASRFGVYADRAARGLSGTGKTGPYGGQSKGGRSAGGLRNWHEAMMTPEARLQGSFAPSNNDSFAPVAGTGTAFDFGGQPSLLALLRSGALDPEPVPGAEVPATPAAAAATVGAKDKDGPRGKESTTTVPASDKGAAPKQPQTPSSNTTAPFPPATASTAYPQGTGGQRRGSLPSTPAGPPPQLGPTAVVPGHAESAAPTAARNTTTPLPPLTLAAAESPGDPITAAAETVIAAIPFDDIPLSPITRTASNLASFLTSNQR